MLKVINVVGARPNFMKAAPIVAGMRRRAAEFLPLVVHTGQHYDPRMSGDFFRDLDLPAPDVHLGVGSASHAQQTAEVMRRFEPVVLHHKPDWVVVVGDVNSTLACALVCAKLLIPVAHVEAGLRSRDRAMPEEINRLLTDQIADLLLTPSADADENLRAEGIPAERIRLVGNVMIDSLLAQLPRAARSNVREELGVAGRDYAVVTLHRPSNVDDAETLKQILSALARVAAWLPVVFPVHPRTRARIGEFGLAESVERAGNLRLTDPLGYLDFLRLYSGARLVLTDSGGLQEETTALGVPCLTLRENTERPVTVTHGTNRVVGTDARKIVGAAFEVLDSPPANRDESKPPPASDESNSPRAGDESGATVASSSRARVPPLWDGRAAERILDALVEAHARRPSE